MKCVVRFENLNPPDLLTSIRCTPGAFLDYSLQPTKMASAHDLNSKSLLNKEAIMSLK